MPATLEDIDVLYEAVKLLRKERRQMQRLSEKAGTVPLAKQQKLAADLNWQALHVAKLEHAAHAAAVDAGIADARRLEHYAPCEACPSPFHRYRVTPPKPKCLREAAA